MDTPSSEDVVVFERVRIGFEDREVLREVSFRLGRGETKVLLGVAGSGKSVILKLAAGLLRPDAGSIRLLGQDITHLSEEELLPLRQKIGIVFQEGALFDSLTVAENVAFRLEEEGRLGEEATAARVREVLRFVEMEEAIGKLPAELSGGMRRRVAIARALVDEPPLMLYDSPTAGLDPITAHTINALILRLRDARGVSAILVTHRLQDAFFLANYYFDAVTGTVRSARQDGRRDTRTRFLLLRDGEIYFEGDQETLLAQHDSYLERYFS